MQESGFRNPALFFDQDAMHDGDLARRPAEAEHGDPRPDLERLAQGYGVCRNDAGLVDGGRFNHER
jgi:hypothetical protein